MLWNTIGLFFQATNKNKEIENRMTADLSMLFCPIS